MSEYTIGDSTSFSNKRNTPGARNSHISSEDRPELLTWLSPLDPGSRHWDIQERRVSDVGEWLIQTEEFRKWNGLGTEGDVRAVLFCYGDPGVGKTFISSLVVDRLCDRDSGQSTPVSCFYLDFAARGEQSATNVLGSLLKQTISGMERVPEEISSAFGRQKTTIGGRRPQLADIVKMLQAITPSQPTFMCLDGLDECSGEQRARLLDSFNQILERSPCARIFATGRPYIREEVERRFAGRVTSVSVSPNRGDITRFLRVRLSEDETIDAMDGRLKADILEKIPQKMSEIFRLISLNIEAILQQSTIYLRRERLSKMADGLGWEDAYGTTIERIMAQSGNKPRLAMEALMWISHAKRPLLVDELCHALGVELGSKDFNAGNVPSISALVGWCQGLIAVDRGRTVRLIHFTLKEYLSALPDIFNRSHSTMAEICLTYLNSKLVKSLVADPKCMIWKAHFLNYSSRYWGAHAKKRKISKPIRSLALELFREYDSHISARRLLAQTHVPDSWRFSNKSDTRFGGLHCASFFGISEFVTALKGMGCYDINGRDCLGYTPLTWAARNGHEGAVKILLEWEEISIEMADNEGQTPLSHASLGGHEGVVKVLLVRKEVNADRPSNKGQTPLMLAAQYGHEGVAKILLGQKGVNPSMADNDGRTPLSYAAQGGHEGVVKVLLGREEVNPDAAETIGRAPLWWASEGGHEGVVKILLEREEVNPDKANDIQETPLLRAALKGHEGVVKMLLARKEVNPNNPDQDSRTPLLAAIERGHVGVVKILLARQEVSAAGPSYSGRTPLSFAAQYRHKGVVEILLMQQEVKPDQPSYGGRTPLSYAAQYWPEGVKILLGREEVNPGQPCDYGRTPLSYAAGHGCLGAVEILLGLEGVSPDEPSYGGRTPLSFAVQERYEDVVKILLERKEVDPNKPDNHGRTPLSYAVQGSLRRVSERVVRILLEREEVYPDRPDNHGRTPLSYAVEGRHQGAAEGVVRTLCRTPLSYAVEGRHQGATEGVVRMLLEREEVNPDKPDNHGRAPLSYAVWHGHEAVATTLLGLKDVNPDKPDNDGRTPLTYAIWGGNEGVAEILLGREEVNPDKPDCGGRTPLSYAAEGGRERSVKALLAREQVNPNRPDNRGETPLMLASAKGYLSVVTLLQPYKTVIHRAF